MDAKTPGLWVVPFIRPYRTRADIQTWFNDPAIYDLIRNEYERGYYRGIGEFHIYGKSAATEWVKKIVDFAVERGLYLHAHCDEEALLILFSHNPQGQDHLGAYRLFDRALARQGIVGDLSGLVGRIVLSQRHHERRRHALGGMA